MTDKNQTPKRRRFGQETRGGAPRLRKQPKRKKMRSATAMARPRLVMPKTATRRKRRNTRRARLPSKGILAKFIFSARWVSLLLLIISSYALYLVGMNTEFYLTTIPVEGASAILEGEIVEASGLAGMHIFAADPALAAERIAEIPGVTSAVVTLAWPNAASIAITEESPVALWQDSGEMYWVTENGRLLPARTRTGGLLVIESEIETAVAAVEEEGSESTASAFAFVPQNVLDGALLLRDLRPNIDKLYYRPSGGLSYQDGRGWRAYFGDGMDMNQKIAIYETIVEELIARGLTPQYISVSNQEKPYYAVQ